MDAVAAAHEDDGPSGAEHEVPANGAIALGGTLNAFMCFHYPNGYAGLAFLSNVVNSRNGLIRSLFTYLAMVEVFPNAHADPANAAVVTMIYILLRVVVPELAYIAIIAGGGFATLLARV
jgi:hypothetical protein